MNTHENEEKTLLKIIQTEDGSQSLFHTELHETYHSRHGAIQESRHVFIEKGLMELSHKKTPINIFEVGFGTGLNALLTANFAIENNVLVCYTSIDTYPLPQEIVGQLNYGNMMSPPCQSLFQQLHACEWNNFQNINPFFKLKKINTGIQEFRDHTKYDLVFFDAFGPPTQPEMWTVDIFQNLASMMNEGGIFVTYCAKGQVRRDLEMSGFKVERLAGPPGKREMLRGRKMNH